MHLIQTAAIDNRWDATIMWKGYVNSPVASLPAFGTWNNRGFTRVWNASLARVCSTCLQNLFHSKCAQSWQFHQQLLCELDGKHMHGVSPRWWHNALHTPPFFRESIKPEETKYEEIWVVSPPRSKPKNTEGEDWAGCDQLHNRCWRRSQRRNRESSTKSLYKRLCETYGETMIYCWVGFETASEESVWRRQRETLMESKLCLLKLADALQLSK